MNITNMKPNMEILGHAVYGGAQALGEIAYTGASYAASNIAIPVLKTTFEHPIIASAVISFSFAYSATKNIERIKHLEVAQNGGAPNLLPLFYRELFIASLKIAVVISAFSVNFVEYIVLTGHQSNK